MAGNRTELPLIYRGIEEISQAANIPKKKLPYFVENEGLPASKLDGREWLAVAVDLQQWVIDRLRKHTSKNQGAAQC